MIELKPCPFCCKVRMSKRMDVDIELSVHRAGQQGQKQLYGTGIVLNLSHKQTRQKRGMLAPKKKIDTDILLQPPTAGQLCTRAVRNAMKSLDGRSIRTIVPIGERSWIWRRTEMRKSEYKRSTNYKVNGCQRGERLKRYVCHSRRWHRWAKKFMSRHFRRTYEIQ